MSAAAQALFVRLFLRVGPWFKLANVSYSEVPDVDAAAAELSAAGLAVSLLRAPPGTRASATRALTVIELASLVNSLGLVPPKTRKQLPRAQLQVLLAQVLGSPDKVRFVSSSYSAFSIG